MKIFDLAEHKYLPEETTKKELVDYCIKNTLLPFYSTTNEEISLFYDSTIPAGQKISALKVEAHLNAMHIFKE